MIGPRLAPSRSRSAGVILLAALATACGQAGAQEAEVGWEVTGEEGYVYADVTHARYSSERRALLLRLEANWIGYQLRDGGGQTGVHSPGAVAGIGISHESELWGIEIVPGLEVRGTGESGDGVSGLTTEFGLACDASFLLDSPSAGRWSLDATRSGALDYTRVRTSVARRSGGEADSTGTLLLGPEATFETTPGERRLGLGALLEFQVAPGSGSLELRAGVSRKQEAGGARRDWAYVGMGIVREF